MLGSVRWWRRLAPDRRRLQGEVAARRLELEARTERPCDDEEAAAQTADPLEISARLLERAAHEAERGTVSAGYEALNAAHRLEVLCYSDEELAAEAIALMYEAAADKISGWREEALVALVDWAEPKLANRPLSEKSPEAEDAGTPLSRRRNAMLRRSRSIRDEALRSDDAGGESGGEDATRPSSVGRKAMLRRALLIRDEALQKAYRKSEIVTWRLWQLLAVIAIAVIALITIAVAIDIDIDAQLEDGFGENSVALTLALSVLFGVLGAAVSGSLSLVRAKEGQRVPELRASTIPALFRLGFGAAAALGSTALLAAGLVDLNTNYSGLLAVAFFSGFSERLVVASAERLGAGSP